MSPADPQATRSARPPRLSSDSLVAVLVCVSCALWVGLSALGVSESLAVVGAVLTVLVADAAFAGRCGRDRSRQQVLVPAFEVAV